MDKHDDGKASGGPRRRRGDGDVEVQAVDIRHAGILGLVKDTLDQLKLNVASHGRCDRGRAASGTSEWCIHSRDKSDETLPEPGRVDVAAVVVDQLWRRKSVCQAGILNTEKLGDVLLRQARNLPKQRMVELELHGFAFGGIRPCCLGQSVSFAKGARASCIFIQVAR